MRRIGGLMAVLAAFAQAGCSGTASGSSSGSIVTATPSPSPSSSPTPTPTPAPSAGGQVFALADPGETSVSIQTYLAKPEVDGIAWRALWRAIEPSDGAYAWTALDAALDAAQAAGKKITIHIGASGGAWPAWLTTAGAATYTATSAFGAINDPVPWDPIYLSRYQRLLSQLAQHVSGRGQSAVVRAVSVGAPVSEMSLAGCASGALGNVAYSRSQYLSAWSATAAAAIAAFPTTPVLVSAPVAQICIPDGDGSAFFGDVMRSVPGAQIFVADLNALGSQRYAQVPSDIRSRALFTQTIWSSTNDPSSRMQGTLSSAVCSARTLGARYFEIYKSDLDSGDAAIRTAIGQARGTATCP